MNFLSSYFDLKFLPKDGRVAKIRVIYSYSARRLLEDEEFFVTKGSGHVENMLNLRVVPIDHVLDGEWELEVGDDLFVVNSNEGCWQVSFDP